MERLPSTDLYFTNACGGWLTRGWGMGRWGTSAGLGRSCAGSVRALSANCFAVGDWRVLVRRDTPAVMRAALDWPGRLAFVLVDDLAAAGAASGLPDGYRQRLTDFARDWAAPLLARADVVLAASGALERDLAAQRGGGVVRRIDPVWAERLADQAHFAPLAAGGTLRIVHLGSASHAGALAHVAPLMAKALDDHPASHFTYFATRPVHPALEEHPRARRMEPMRWSEYRRWLARQRFHLALYPLAPCRFDRARSASKLIEHAIVGAVGVYAEDWAPAAPLLRTRGAFAAPSNPADWADVLGRAMTARAALQPMAHTSAKYLSACGFHATQQSLWRDLLSIPGN